MVASRFERVAIITGCLIGAVTLAQVAGRHLAADGVPADQGLLTYYIAPGDDVPGYRSSDRQLATWALNAWTRSAGGAFRTEATQEPEALVRVYWAPANGSTYGEMRRLNVAGHPGAAVFVRPDTHGLLPERTGQDV